jgi:crossover junction endodeoxyribonuclease RuvC
MPTRAQAMRSRWETSRSQATSARAVRLGESARDEAYELRLWSALKARQLGVQFLREVSLLGRFVVDFCAPSVWLVVEVDGGCHAELRAADARRDAQSRGAGYPVLRLEAQVAMHSLGKAVKLVRAALGARSPPGADAAVRRPARTRRRPLRERTH